MYGAFSPTSRAKPPAIIFLADCCFHFYDQHKGKQKMSFREMSLWAPWAGLLARCDQEWFIHLSVITPCVKLLLAFTLVSCWAYSSTLKMEAICSSKCWLPFNGLHGVIPQKVELFIITAVSASNPAYLDLIHRNMVTAVNSCLLPKRKGKVPVFN
jgi:hypothetical protein